MTDFIIYITFIIRYPQTYSQAYVNKMLPTYNYQTSTGNHKNKTRSDSSAYF